MVAPSERIVGGEDRRRQPGECLFERLPRFRWQLDSERRIVGPEDLRQHRRGESASERPGILALLPGEFPAVVEGDRSLVLRLDQEAVLGQKPCEQHPVPVFVRHFAREPLHFLLFPAAAVPELPPVRPQPAPKRPFRPGQGRVGLRLAHHERPER